MQKTHIVKAFILGCTIGVSPSLAQQGFRIPPQQQQIPPDAWRRMDTHSPIDPRILEAQRQAQEAAKRQQRLDERKAQYAQALWQRVHKDRSLYLLNQAAQAAAVSDAANYLALRDVDGPAKAEQWIRACQNSIRQDISNSGRNLSLGAFAIAAGVADDSGPTDALRQQQEISKAHLQILQALVGIH